MGRKGFTLMELIIVIVILAILATIGFRQYALTIEKSKTAEARACISNIRQEAYDFYIRNNSTLTPVGVTQFDDEAAGIDTVGATPGLLPATLIGCQLSHDFTYGLQNVTAATVDIVATRCGLASGGKTEYTLPGAIPTLTLQVNLAGGTDAWVGTGVYR